MRVDATKEEVESLLSRLYDLLGDMRLNQKVGE
jgi:hypothetical protein